MSARKSLVGGLAALVAGSALVFTAGPASADPVYTQDPDDTTFAATTGDLIGVGSDTTQHVMKLAADAWNADASHTFKISTYAATEAGHAPAADGTIPLPSGSIVRPNGSGAGKKKLYAPGNNTDVDFARSSAGLTSSGTTPAGDPEIENNLKAFPFAKDTVITAVSQTTPSHAPASITAAQLVDIYKCLPCADNWSELGGSAGTIVPQLPQTGSGTSKFFLAQLQAANGGTAVTLGGCVVTTVQEHDDSTVMNNPDAIVPMSKGRALLHNGTVRIMNGFFADRAVYNVVRGADVSDAKVQAVFGQNGFLCSAAAHDLIAEAGFEQLATPAHEGACGAPVNSTSNFTLNEPVETTTTVTATSPSANSVHLVAQVTGSTAPTGTVSFYEGPTQLQADVPLVSGQATLNKSSVMKGSHTYRAVYTPNDSIFLGSEDTGSVSVADPIVKTKPAISETFPAKVHLKKAKAVAVKGSVSVSGATGKVTIKKGSKVIKTGMLKSGKVSLTLPKMKKGTYKLTIVYAGDATHLGGSKTFTVKVVK